MTADTGYANTDFDLKSKPPFDTLQRELGATCCVLHYTLGEDGHWHSIIESDRHADLNRDAATDILALLHAVDALSPIAKAELDFIRKDIALPDDITEFVATVNEMMAWRNFISGPVAQ